MNIKLFIKNFLFKIGLSIEKISKKNDLKEFINQFKKNYVSTHLIRIGGDGDGGYLVPNIFEHINYCFSAGVGDISKFEKELSEKYKIKSFLADASINSPAENDKNFFFTKKFLGSRSYDNFISLGDWISQSIKDKNKKKILQMDIEGSEYEVLSFESSESLSQFSLMVIEFHNLYNLSNRNFLRMITAVFQKIYKNFSICHVHPNNYSGIYNLNGLMIPGSIEVTFVRNDFLYQIKSNTKITLPHLLDKKTVEYIPEINMPEIWWKD